MGRHKRVEPGTMTDQQKRTLRWLGELGYTAVAGPRFDDGSVEVNVARRISFGVMTMTLGRTGQFRINQ